MSVHRPHLSLDEFILEMSRRPVGSLTNKKLIEHCHRLRLPNALIEGRTRFTKDQYTRNLVCRTPEFELLALCWRPGHESTIHDHVGSLNAITVFSGELTSRTFAPAGGRPRGAGPVEMASEERVRPGQGWIGVDRRGIHQLANTSGKDLITVHVYAPALMELTVYSTESPEVERRRLRYTLAEDLT